MYIKRKWSKERKHKSNEKRNDEEIRNSISYSLQYNRRSKEWEHFNLQIASISSSDRKEAIQKDSFSISNLPIWMETQRPDRIVATAGRSLRLEIDYV